jgi:hypothetical protein
MLSTSMEIHRQVLCCGTVLTHATHATEVPESGMARRKSMKGWNAWVFQTSKKWTLQ